MAVAQFKRDFLHLLASPEEIARLVYPQLVQPLLRRPSELFAKISCKMSRRNLAQARQAFGPVAGRAGQWRPFAKSLQMTPHANMRSKNFRFSIVGRTVVVRRVNTCRNQPQ